MTLKGSGGGSCNGSPTIIHKMRVPSIEQVGDFVLYGSKYDRRKYYKGHLLYNLPMKKHPTVCLTGFMEWYEKYRPNNKNMVIFRFEYHVMRIELSRRKQRCRKTNHSTC